jgi:hypothetical protein
MGRAHNYSVNTLMWHPVGHQLASAANDGIVKFWCREPPGSVLVSEEGTEEAVGTRFGPITPEEAASVLPDVASHPLASSNVAFDGGSGGGSGMPPIQTTQYHQQHQRVGQAIRTSNPYLSHGQTPHHQQHRGGASGGYHGSGSSHYQQLPLPQSGYRHAPSAPLPPFPHASQHVNRQAAESFMADQLGAGGGGDRKRSRFT